jgi:histidine phosphotransferase ChpT
MQAVDLAGLLCSRLCHDLISPIGSLLNGIELLADEADPEVRAHFLEMLGAGAKRTADKLSFFRLAFGSSTSTSELVATSEAHAALEGLHGEGSTIQLDWRVARQALPKPHIKSMLALAMTAGDAMIWGGRLLVEAGEGPIVDLRVRAEATKLVVAPDIMAALAGGHGSGTTTPRAAAIYMVQEIVAAHGAALEVLRPDDGGLELRTSLPLRP